MNFFTRLKYIFSIMALLASFSIQGSSVADDIIIDDLSTSEVKRLQFYETNPIAAQLCYLIDFVTGDVVKLILALVFCVMSYKAYFGAINIGVLISMGGALLILTFHGYLVSLFVTTADISIGCKCSSVVPYGRDANNQVVYADIKLTPDCKSKI